MEGLEKSRIQLISFYWQDHIQLSDPASFFMWACLLWMANVFSAAMKAKLRVREFDLKERDCGNVVIIDDDHDDSDKLKECLTSFFQFTPLSIFQAHGNKKLDILDLILKHKPDVCFLETDLRCQSGVQVAWSIWMEKKQDTNIIFYSKDPDDAYIYELNSIRSKIHRSWESTHRENYTKKKVRPPAYGFIAKNSTDLELRHGIEQVAWRIDYISKEFRDALDRPLITEEENEVLKHLAIGLKTAEIAEQVSLSKNGVDTRLKNLYMKILRDSNKRHSPSGRAVYEAFQMGLLNTKILEDTDKKVSERLTRRKARMKDQT